MGVQYTYCYASADKVDSFDKTDRGFKILRKVLLKGWSQKTFYNWVFSLTYVFPRAHRFNGAILPGKICPEVHSMGMVE
jgi:hypothetical protein